MLHHTYAQIYIYVQIKIYIHDNNLFRIFESNFEKTYYRKAYYIVD